MSATDLPWLQPDWPAPANVRVGVTTRLGGVSTAPYGTLNLGDHVGDDVASVAANRARVRACLPAEPFWLQQVHGTTVARLDDAEAARVADAAVASTPGRVCVVMTADCLPVLLCNRAGTAVGAAHAGWRGLADGVLEATVAAMGTAPSELLAWFGPAIGPTAFEVGDEVRATFIAHTAEAAQAFRPGRIAGKWWADLYLLARQRLATLGVQSIHGGDLCTVSDAERFFSYRRDGITGRMASLIWLDAGSEPAAPSNG
ncbi:peptidoglycan editing factor PgeF [Chitiniphilus eburneus]|uniref:Purine nucleoside phosphorylase n=1 Tax=Chitiniphilus eburneus TaxID=2571148 RepID=A0A4U0PWF7_9NEIS|nr:peptidoglycan editing factor PgeF [Chitiniphilus eburneus]TJZ72901.1 peptidoglycan editing factor PgeF [Chitiniphilus eburneus]